MGCELTEALVFVVVQVVFDQFKVPIFKDVIVQIFLLQLAFAFPLDLICHLLHLFLDRSVLIIVIYVIYYWIYMLKQDSMRFEVSLNLDQIDEAEHVDCFLPETFLNSWSQTFKLFMSTAVKGLLGGQHE